MLENKYILYQLLRHQLRPDRYIDCIHSRRFLSHRNKLSRKLNPLDGLYLRELNLLEYPGCMRPVQDFKQSALCSEHCVMANCSWCFEHKWWSSWSLAYVTKTCCSWFLYPSVHRSWICLSWHLANAIIYSLFNLYQGIFF